MRLLQLLELQIEGYRSLKNVRWKPGDLNVVIGPNGSGKTNLVRALQLLSVAARGGLKKYIAEQGGVLSLCWDHKAAPVRLKVKACEAGEIVHEETASDTFSYDMTFHVSEAPGGGVDYSLAEQLTLIPSKHDDPKGPQFIKLVDRLDPGLASFFSAESKQMAPVRQEVDIHETVLSLVGALIGFKAFLFRKGLKGFAIYRELDTSQEAPVRRAVPAQWEKELGEDASNIVAYLHTFCSEDRAFKRDLELAMKAAFGDDFEELVFAPASDQRIQMRIRWRSLKNPISAPDLSDGTLRFLFLIGALLNPQPPPLIVIEEPEIGLHPRMMSIIAEYAVDASERTQVIFTTHSPDFLSAFRGTIPTTTVCSWEDGETVLRVLEEKDLEYWLQEYTLGQFAFSGAAEAVE